MNRRDIIIGIVILIIIILGFVFFSNMTGNVITGSAVGGEKIDNEYFKIDQINGEKGGNLNDVQNNGEQK